MSLIKIWAAMGFAWFLGVMSWVIADNVGNHFLVGVLFGIVLLIGGVIFSMWTED